MSLTAMQWVFTQSKSAGTDRLVLLILADYANEDGVCWPNLSTISARANATPRTISRCIQVLRSIGEIELLVQGSGSCSNHYRIRMTEVSTTSEMSTTSNLALGMTFLVGEDDKNVVGGMTELSTDPPLIPHEPKKNPQISCPTTPDGDGQQSAPLKSKKQEVRDPLENLPMLSKAYDAIQSRIKKVHPRAKIPEPGTKADIGARSTLECLVRLDKHSEQEILDTLRWVLYTEPEGDFTWRAQFHSIVNLRKVKGGMSKFAKMFEAMKRFQKQAARAKIDPDEPIHHREAREKGILV